jgi:hypothetical protein
VSEEGNNARVIRASRSLFVGVAFVEHTLKLAVDHIRQPLVGPEQA